MVSINRKNAKQINLETAVKIFADNSFDGAQVDQIAAAANVLKSLIYYHFKSKDEILETLVDDFFTHFMDFTETAKDALPESESEVKLHF